MTSRLSYAVAGEIAIIVDILDSALDKAEFEKKIVKFERELSLLITFQEGEALTDHADALTGWIMWEPMISKSLRGELEQKIDIPFQINVDFQEKWIEVRLQTQNGVLSISMPQRRLFSSSSYVFLIWVFGVSFILLLISVAFMRNQIRPIRRLAIAADRFGKGRDVKDFKVEGAKEVRQAGQAFIDMKTRIQRQISQRTDMLAAVSHDLRTPLTRMKLQMAVAKPSADIEAIQGDISDMEKMIEGYLSFVRGEGQEQSILTDVNALVIEAITDTQRQGANISFMNRDVDIHLPIKPMAFKRCVSNILTNAAKYAKNTAVTMSMDEDGWIDLLIEDDGPGVPSDQYEAVFRPFYRVDTSRNMDTGGVGLGMSIAMDIVLAHGGKIWLDRSNMGGLAVHIGLPI